MQAGASVGEKVIVQGTNVFSRLLEPKESNSTRFGVSMEYVIAIENPQFISGGDTGLARFFQERITRNQETGQPMLWLRRPVGKQYLPGTPTPIRFFDRNVRRRNGFIAQGELNTGQPVQVLVNCFNGSGNLSTSIQAICVPDELTVQYYSNGTSIEEFGIEANLNAPAQEHKEVAYQSPQSEPVEHEAQQHNQTYNQQQNMLDNSRSGFQQASAPQQNMVDNSQLPFQNTSVPQTQQHNMVDHSQLPFQNTPVQQTQQQNYSTVGENNPFN